MSKEMGEMGRSRQVGQAGVSAPPEGARRATAVGAEGASAGAAPLASGAAMERGPEAGRGAAAVAGGLAGGVVARGWGGNLPAGVLAGPGVGRP